jgi:hypothetical protein
VAWCKFSARRALLTELVQSLEMRRSTVLAHVSKSGRDSRGALGRPETRLLAVARAGLRADLQHYLLRGSKADISRSTSVSALLSTRERRSTISSVIGGLSIRLGLNNPTYQTNTGDPRLPSYITPRGMILIEVDVVGARAISARADGRRSR